MANATVRVQVQTVPVTEEKLEWGLTNAAATYYTNAMLGLKSDGYGTKYDDAVAAMPFLGLVHDLVPVVVDSNDAAGDKKVQVHRPKYLEMLCNDTLADTDVGKPVFAKFDNEVTYAPGVYANYVGKVVKKIDSTHLLIEPLYCEGPNLLQITMPYDANIVDRVFWVAQRPATVVAVQGRVDVAGTDNSNVTISIKKVASGTGIASGTALTTADFNAKGTANTNQSLTVGNVSVATLAAGAGIGLDLTGTATAAVGSITVSVIPHGL